MNLCNAHCPAMVGPTKGGSVLYVTVCTLAAAQWPRYSMCTRLHNEREGPANSASAVTAHSAHAQSPPDTAGPLLHNRAPRFVVPVPAYILP